MCERSTSPRKHPVQARSRQTVATILEATAQVLIASGYDRTTTNSRRRESRRQHRLPVRVLSEQRGAGRRIGVGSRRGTRGARGRRTRPSGRRDAKVHGRRADPRRPRRAPGQSSTSQSLGGTGSTDGGAGASDRYQFRAAAEDRVRAATTGAGAAAPASAHDRLCRRDVHRGAHPSRGRRSAGLASDGGDRGGDSASPSALFRAGPFVMTFAAAALPRALAA